MTLLSSFPRRAARLLLILSLLASGCAPLSLAEANLPAPAANAALAAPADAALPPVNEPILNEQAAPSAPSFTPRPLYAPGELVDYIAQPGDTLPHLARRFNTTPAEIMQANSFIPASATTMPPGMPMKIPIYYLPLWGPSYNILPDGLFVNGPAQVAFDTEAFVSAHPGWLNGFRDYVSGATRSGAGIVDLVARNFSVSPRLLLALLEYQGGALSDPNLSPEVREYPLGHRSWDYKRLYMQLTWAANLLNNGYYAYRTEKLTEITYPDGRMERLDPWLNASSAALHNYFNQSGLSGEAYLAAVSPQGLAQTYAELFGDPWADPNPHIPGSLVQPEFILPFQPGAIWALTGGPHTGWGTGLPFAALDFAPPSKFAGCVWSDQWATAVAAGVVVRSEVGQVMLDLDGDGDERTGWNIFYLHLATDGRAVMGQQVARGEPVGHPSCEGGQATGTHIHIARKYNGEWMSAEDPILPFNLEGWVAHEGSQVYLGTLTRFSQVVTACTCSNAASFIQTDRPKP
jgi:murein DD-endopeptidase MepM/ murein hydrolase activator NlpD